MHPDSRHLVKSVLSDAIEKKQGWTGLELKWLHKNGSTRFFESSSHPHFDDNGNLTGFSGVDRDITERKRLAARLQESQKMESIGNLAGGISHDFNNLLFPIIGLSEMLLEDLAPGSPEHQSARQILKAGKRGSELVKQILAFSRQSEYEKRPLRIQQILNEVLRLSRSTIPSDIEISHDIQPNCGLVMADPTRIHQIAMNLITNAYHAVEPSGGKIGVQLEEAVLAEHELAGSPLTPGKYVVMRISDTGCGIDPGIMDKIFEPYFTTKDREKGTGLGLAVVYGIVRDYGGDVQVESEVGKGTTFTVFTPLMEQSPEAKDARRVTRLPKGRERILLVDDEDAIANVERMMLERLGYQVTSFTGSLDALEAFHTAPHAFDLVLTDMAMPNMTGDQLAMGIKMVRPDLPVIICTGFSQRIDEKKATLIGIKGLLMKPVVKSELARMVRSVLDETQLQTPAEPILITDS